MTPYYVIQNPSHGFVMSVDFRQVGTRPRINYTHSYPCALRFSCEGQARSLVTAIYDMLGDYHTMENEKPEWLISRVSMVETLEIAGKLFKE